jgi:hypothetical protein
MKYPMRGNELIRLIQGYARSRGIRCDWHPELGKDAHGLLVLGGKRCVIRNSRDRINTETLHIMVDQLGLSITDIC